MTSVGAVTTGQTALYFMSELGDYIGGGLEIALTEADVDFVVSRIHPTGSVRSSVTRFNQQTTPERTGALSCVHGGYGRKREWRKS